MRTTDDANPFRENTALRHCIWKRC